jgi:pimeloyl-ACP methyl ester carboxylesterase
VNDVQRWAGWYEGDGRIVLLTHIPDASLGEPMVLLSDGDRVVRDDDGETRLELTPEGIRLNGKVMTRSRRYEEREVGFDGGRLAGTLITPQDPGTLGTHPAAVMVHGAAGGQRDFYRLFVKPVLDAGIAVLIYDRRDPTIFGQAAAAEAGLEFLAALPEIDPGRIGLVGLSNGMWAIPMAAAARSDVAFVAGIGAPGVSMAECEVHRRTKALREAGLSATTVEQAETAWRCIFEVVAGNVTEELTRRLDKALRSLQNAEDVRSFKVPAYARENPLLSPLPPDLPAGDLVSMLSAEPDPEVSYDPAADYARIGCPVLLQWGSEDSSIPVAESVRRIHEAQPHVTTRVYPGLEHVLNEIPRDIGLTPEEAMYGFHRFRFGQGVWDELTAWLAQTVH